MTCTHATTHSQTLEGKKTGDDCEQTLEYKYKIKEKKRSEALVMMLSLARSLALRKKHKDDARPLCPDYCTFFSLLHICFQKMCALETWQKKEGRKGVSEGGCIISAIEPCNFG